MTRRGLPGSDSYHIWHCYGCSGKVGGVFWKRGDVMLREAVQQKGQGMGGMMKKMRWGRAPRQEVTRHTDEEEEEEVGIFTTSILPFYPSFHHTHTHTSHGLFFPSTIANYQICWLGSVHLKLSVTVDGRLNGPFIPRCRSCRWERTPSLLFYLQWFLSDVSKFRIVPFIITIWSKALQKTATDVFGQPSIPRKQTT